MVAVGFASLLRVSCDRRSLSPPACTKHTGKANTPLHCFANFLTTSRLREHPVAIPLTPPSGLVSAVNLITISASANVSWDLGLGQTVARRQQQLERVCVVQQSFQMLASNRQVLMKTLEAHFSDLADMCFDPIEWECPAQNRELILATVCRGPELRCISSNVASLPAVKHCRALDTSPSRTHCSAALAFCSSVVAWWH